MPRNNEVPGNAMESQRLFQVQMARNGILLQKVEIYLERYEEEDTHFTGITVKFPQDIGGDYFCIIRAMVVGNPMVAFHGAPEFSDALLGICRRLQNRSLRWKEDQYG